MKAKLHSGVLLAAVIVGAFSLPTFGAEEDITRRLYGGSPAVIEIGAALRSAEPRPAFTVNRSRAPAAGELLTPFASAALPLVLDHVALRDVSGGSVGSIEIPLEAGITAVAEIHRVKRRGATATLVGKLRDHDLSEVLIVYHRGVISGSAVIYDEGRHYEFGTLADGSAVVRTLNIDAFVHDCGTHDDQVFDDPGTPPAAPAAEGGSPEIEAPASTVITMDLVVGYGREARIAEGGVAAMEAKIVASVDRMNTAFANSSITNVELVLLGTVEDPYYVFPGASNGTMGLADELGDLGVHGDGSLDTISQMRIDLGADLNAFVIKGTDGPAGVASRPGNKAVIARTYMSSAKITFVHELGHNIGCRHAWGDTDCLTSGHNYGWRMQSGGSEYRTIMAYDWDWQRVPYFSNPNIQYAGVNTGATNGYDATGDPTTDSRFVTTGYSGDCTSGFDGTHPNLGAFNAQYIQDRAYTVADNASRAGLSVTSPTAGEIVPPGSSYTIEWVGGVYGDTVDLDLYHDGVFDSQVATGLFNNARSNVWLVPANQAAGTGYTVRISLNGGTSSATGEAFSITLAALACDTTDLNPTCVGGENASPDSFEVWNEASAASNMVYAISTNAPWLSVSPASGSSTGEHDVIEVNYQTSGLATGVHQAVITIDAPNAAQAPKYIDVDLLVTPPPPTPQLLPYSQDFSSGLPGGGDGWDYYSTADGRIQVVLGQLQMDDADDGGSYALNEAILHLDMTGMSNVSLVFDHDNISDEPHAMPASFTGHAYVDGVSVSEDGVTWYKVMDLVGDFIGLELDLDSVVSGAGISYSSDFRVKFQQYDNYPVTTDGRAFDNIVIDQAPFLACAPLSISSSVPVGLSADAENFTVVNEGGGSMAYSVATNAPWLSVSPSSGTGTGETDVIQIVFNTSGLAVGDYSAEVETYSADAVNLAKTVAVALTVFDIPEVESMTADLADVSFSIPTQPGWLYILQCRTDLVSGAWLNLSTNVGDGGDLEITRSNEFGRAFYRILIQDPE